MTDRVKAIRDRAYFKFLERGGQDGHDLDDWLEAEKESKTTAKKKRASAARKTASAKKRTTVKSSTAKKK